MKTMIEGYTSFPGEHCGSVAMGGLLNHYCGLELPEAAVFGLGSGASCAYLSGGPLDPSAMVAGRTSHMEQDLATNLQLDYREQAEVTDFLAKRLSEAEAGPIEASIGIPGIRAFANDVQGWQTRDDAQNLAGFNASCIEKFGNGGGNFRRLYAGFLSWAAELDSSLVPAKAPGLCVEAADGWTGISNALFAASKDPSDPEPWKNASLGAARVVDIEERLFGMLAEAAG